MAKILRLNVYKKWFDMIKSGEKKSDYRELNRENFIKFFNFDFEKIYIYDCYSYIFDKHFAFLKNYEPIDFEKVVFVNIGDKELKEDEELIIENYEQIEFKLKQITIGYGRQKWGAEKGKKYFVIKSGERIK